MIVKGNIIRFGGMKVKKRYILTFILIGSVICGGCKEEAKDGGFGGTIGVRENMNNDEVASDTKYNESMEKNKVEVLEDDEIISKLLLQEANRGYSLGECGAEGNIILGKEIKGKNKFIYALSMVGNYGFENGIFTKVSGSGVIPIVVTLDENNCTHIEYPLDGSEYAESIEKMFPKEYQEIIWNSLDNSSENYKKIKAKEIDYAKVYLEKIDRATSIEDYVEKVLLTDKGVSVEVSNDMIETFYKEHHKYPYFIGNQEVIENGIRMVYEMNYDEEKLIIKFIKYNYDTKEEVEKFIFDSKTGEQVI